MNILIVSPSFIPDASVGRLRMLSIVKYLKKTNDITVIQNKISSYERITDEKPLDGVKTVQVDVSGDFRTDADSYKHAVADHLHDFKYDVAIISVGPYYTLPLVSLIKKISQTKVILDYRDLWSVSYRENEKSNRIKRMIKSILIERPALKMADAITCCDEESLEALISQYKFLQNTYCETVMNGYDDEALKGFEVAKKVGFDQEAITIAIYGKFEVYIGIDNLSWFAKTLEMAERKIYRKIEVLHFGREEHKLRDALAEYGIMYNWGGYVKYRDGMESLSRNADILLAANDVYYGYGTKIFDYIFLNKPVLMYAVPGSTLYHFVGKFENGYSFACKEELLEALLKISEKRAYCLEDGIEAKRFSRSQQNKIFESVICLTDEKNKSRK